MQPRVIALGVGVVAIAVVFYLIINGGDDDAGGTSGDAASLQAEAAQLATQIAGVTQASPAGLLPTATRPAGTTPVAGATPGGSLAPGATAPAGAAADFAATNRAHQALRSYRLTSEYVTAPGASPLRIIIEVQNPDRYHATFPTLTPGAGAATIEVIGIGPQTYVKVGPTWTQGGAATSVPFQAGQILGPVAGFMSSSNAVRGATTTVAGASCTVWIVTTPQNQRADVCVGNDALIRQLKYTEGNTSQTLTFDMFNSSFNIVAP